MNKFDLFQKQMEKDFEGGSQEVFDICKSLLDFLKKHRKFHKVLFWQNYCDGQGWLSCHAHYPSFEFALMYFLGKLSEIPKNICKGKSLTPLLFETSMVWMTLPTINDEYDEEELFTIILSEFEYNETLKLGKIKCPYTGKVFSLFKEVHIGKRIEFNEDFF